MQDTSRGLEGRLEPREGEHDTRAVSEEFRGKRVVVLGLARSGVAAARLLAGLGATVRVTELRRTDELDLLARALQEERIEVELGRHSTSWVKHCDLVVTSPGIEPTAAPRVWAASHDVPVISEIELAFRVCPAPVVAVTGTNGKTTVTTLISRMFEQSGRHAPACGNIGRPFSDVVSGLRDDSVAVVEVSSFQLDTIQRFRPSIAVLLNIDVDHLSYHGSFEAYARAKQRVFMNQRPEDVAVLNAGDPQVAAMASGLASRVRWFGGATETGSEAVAGVVGAAAGSGASAVGTASAAGAGGTARAGEPSPFSRRILLNPDFHAAAIAAQEGGVSVRDIEAVIEAFRGLPHRCESVATIGGVHFINDSKSTNLSSLRWALQRMTQPVVLIAGGRDKGGDWRTLRPLVSETVRHIVVIGEAAPLIRAAFEDAVGMSSADDLPSAVQRAMSRAAEGETVLLSPGCASFDMFQNYEHRGDVFRQCVRELAACEVGAADDAS